MWLPSSTDKLDQLLGFYYWKFKNHKRLYHETNLTEPKEVCSLKIRQNLIFRNQKFKADVQRRETLAKHNTFYLTQQLPEWSPHFPTLLLKKTWLRQQTAWNSCTAIPQIYCISQNIQFKLKNWIMQVTGLDKVPWNHIKLLICMITRAQTPLEATWTWCRDNCSDGVYWGLELPDCRLTERLMEQRVFTLVCCSADQAEWGDQSVCVSV